MYRHASEILQVCFQNTTIKQHPNKSSCNLFAGRESCLQLRKNTMPVEYNKAKYIKTRYA